MTKSTAIIVCDHGLGHVRRCALMAKELEKQDKNVTLFAPRASVERLQRALPSTAGLKVHDFATHTRPVRIREGLPGAVLWLDRLPDLDGFDTVICDNLPEILARRPDATLSAQFFWYDVVDGAARDYAAYCEEMLERHRPIVIGCDLFAMDVVRSQPGFQPVRLYAAPEFIAAARETRPEERTDLLVTGGTTPAVRAQLKGMIEELLREGSGPFERVHVDPELLPENAHEWMVKADFTVAMYRRLSAAICRPGLGVLTDLLTVGARPFVIYEDGNAEMQHNAEVLDVYGLGEELTGSGQLDKVRGNAMSEKDQNEFLLSP